MADGDGSLSNFENDDDSDGSSEEFDDQDLLRNFVHRALVRG